MKIVSQSFLFAAAVLLTGSHASAQFQTVSHCQCNGHATADSGFGCPGGQCESTGACWTCDGSGACSSGNCHAGQGCHSQGCLGRLCAGKGYPDAGWAPPARLPVNRDRVWYHTWHPQAFYGNQGGGFIANYPQVYQPSDTTQLGYSYQIVPTWQSRPGMIPPVPNPSAFHSRVCPASAHGGCFSGDCQGGNCLNTTGTSEYYSGYAQSSPQPTNYGSQAVRPAHYSRSRNPFRLSSLSDLFD